MNSSYLLLLVAVAMAQALHYNSTFGNKRERRELLSRSKRRWVLSTIELVEEDGGPFPKPTTQMFNDRTKQENDVDHMFSISGTGVTLPPLGVFSIDEQSGMVFVHKAIDRETNELFHIKFDILNRATGLPIDRTLAFDVAISDINDNVPTFDHPIMKASVRENTPEGLLPVRLQARDMDEVNTINSTFTIKVLSQEPKEPELKVDHLPGTTMGQLSFEGCFNYDKVNKYKVIVEVKDHGKPPLSSTAVVNLNILDSNSHMPKFKQRMYKGEIQEMEINKEILRVGVEDKDSPKTPGWKAKYYFIKGNEDNNYKITTDPKTNEGILTVIKGKDFEKANANSLQIGVENEEPLFVCTSKKGGSTAAPPPPDTVNITLTVIDVNDPPQFEKNVTNVYAREEEEPGRTLFKPKITDVDSEVNKIRFDLLEDPGRWVTIDHKTGIIKTAVKMDRESPFVDDRNIYTIVVAAIDNGEPPATASSTILVHLRDINDNLPKLLNNSMVMCANKGSKVTIMAADRDKAPFSGPFSFSLGEGDGTLKKNWRIDRTTGDEAGLVALTSLPYANYSVPLVVQDQQGMVGDNTVVLVTLCDCDDRDACRGKLPLSSGMGSAAIGLLFSGLLLLLLMLLLLFMCECVGKQFLHDPVLQDEGNQTLIKYNEEGGGSPCMTEPTLMLPPTHNITMTDAVKMSSAPTYQSYQITTQDHNSYQSSAHMSQMNYMRSQSMQQHQPQPQRSMGDAGEMGLSRSRSMYSTLNTNRTMSNRSGSLKYSLTSNMLSDQLLADNIDNKLYALAEGLGDYPLYRPLEYAYEGDGSKCQSLDKLSMDLADDLDFLGDLGPKFQTLGGIVHQGMREKNTQL